MGDPLVIAVRVVVERFGEEVLVDPARFRNLLNDQLGSGGVSMHREVDLIVRVVDPRVLPSVRSDGHTGAIARSLAQDRVLDEADAEYAISTLRTALGTEARGRDEGDDTDDTDGEDRRTGARGRHVLALGAGAAVLIVVLVLAVLAGTGDDGTASSSSTTEDTAGATSGSTARTADTEPTEQDLRSSDMHGEWVLEQGTIEECATVAGGPAAGCGVEIDLISENRITDRITFQIDCDSPGGECWVVPFRELGYPSEMTGWSTDRDGSHRRYTTGDVPPELWGDCDGEPVPTEFSLYFIPSAATLDGETWVADRIEGELEKVWPPFGSAPDWPPDCGGTARYSFTLTRP